MASFRRAFRRLFTLLPLLFPLMASAQVVELLGPQEIANAIRPYLPEGDVADGAGREQYQRRLEKLLPELLATEGWFSPELSFAWKGERLEASIRPGPRTTVTSVDIRIEGALPAQERAALVAGWALPVGQVFRQADWSGAKEALLARLLAVDHAAASLADSSAEIDPLAHSARLSLVFDAGPAYRFGPLKIIGLTRYRADLVERYNLAVREGQPYSEEKLAALQRTLQSSPYFSSAQVELERDTTIVKDGAVTAPVLVRLTEREPHRLGFGVGASSNTGARGEVNFHSADFLRRAWELNSGVRIEQKQSTVFADVFLPPDKAQGRDSVGVLLQSADIQGLKTESFSLGTQRVQQRGQLEVRLGVNWLLERKKPADALQTTDRALVGSSMWTWRQVDSLLDPRQGLVAQVQVGGASKAVLSDRDFLRLQGKLQAYLPLGRRDQLMLRLEAGQTLAKSRDGIPQDYLFRAGGSGSVRGYGYQSLGVAEGSAVVGGRYLLTGSAESTHWLDDKWGVAAFFDAGNAADSRADLRLNRGYGVGGRWKSPAGPLALDLAWAPQVHMPRLHFALAIPF